MAPGSAAPFERTASGVKLAVGRSGSVAVIDEPAETVTPAAAPSSRCSAPLAGRTVSDIGPLAARTYEANVPSDAVSARDAGIAPAAIATRAPASPRPPA